MSNAPWSMSPRRSTVVAARPLAALLLALSIFSQAAWAQDPAAPARQRPLELPQEEVVSFDTKDGVRLVATYYPGTKGKDSVPIIMLHGSMGNRADFDGLARHMQEQGHAVIVPDLRGHGESTIVQGTTKKLSAETMPIRQYAYMVQLDVERVKSFLLDQHRDQKLNIDKLVVVGAEVGALIAMNWT
ncbi:MAG: alpha/beta fold hydrolase, partial [Pirellulales bacterium]